MYKIFLELFKELRKTAGNIALELAYMASVGTIAVPPFGVLRKPFAKLVKPETFSAIVLGLGGEELDLAINAMLGVRLGGIPSCKKAGELMPELGLLCKILKERGGEPLYSITKEAIPPLAVVLTSLGMWEGEVLLSAYRTLVGDANEMEQIRVLKYFDREYASLSI